MIDTMTEISQEEVIDTMTEILVGVGERNTGKFSESGNGPLIYK